MSDAFDALREADTARRRQVRDAMKLADLLRELESIPSSYPWEPRSAQLGRESAAAIRRVVGQRVDAPLAPPDALHDLIEWAEKPEFVLAPLTESERRELAAA